MSIFTLYINVLYLLMDLQLKVEKIEMHYIFLIFISFFFFFLIL
jgi:hypothetical protein